MLECLHSSCCWKVSALADPNFIEYNESFWAIKHFYKLSYDTGYFGGKAVSSGTRVCTILFVTLIIL